MKFSEWSYMGHSSESVYIFLLRRDDLGGKEGT